MYVVGSDFCHIMQMSMNVPVILTTAAPMQCALTVMVATCVGAHWGMMGMDMSALVSDTDVHMIRRWLIHCMYVDTYDLNCPL